MKIIVCDDNKNYANSLMDNIANIISKSTLFENIPFDCKYIYPAKLLFEYAKKHPIDILFLDISMPGTDGLDIAETFHDYYPSTKLLFITNYEQYVFYSFRFSPFRYIRKNNLNNELEEALLSATNDIYNNNDFITITNRDQCIQISLSNIMYFEKEKNANYIQIYTNNGIYRYRNNISELMQILNNNIFIKINSGMIINMKYITSIKGKIIELTNQENVLIAQKYVSTVKAKYIEYMRIRRER